MSIAFVVLGHLTGTRHFPSGLDAAHAFAGPGVRVFFVISGLLITTLLLKELDQTGRISITGFYRRRAFRIFPAFYTYLAAVALFGLARPGELVRAATYTINYVEGRSWIVAHIWSLAVEEQFYILWPLTVVALGRRSLLVAGAVVVLSPFIRLAQYDFFPAYRAGIGAQFHTVCDAIACGCLLAGLRDRLWAISWYRRFLQSRWFGLLPLTLVSELAIQPGRLRYFSVAGMTILNLGITVCVDRAVRMPHNWSGRILNTPPVVFVGVLSYSIYLWQQFFLNRSLPETIHSFPLNLGLAGCAALASYYLVEKPMIAFGRSSLLTQCLERVLSKDPPSREPAEDVGD